ncbi:MAG: hypothetical protein H7Z11_15235 [Verrucomicrobia bacterium]|nr:hypothetical protein [Leptolyngbya sp. ES-bin-22]
MSKARDRVYDLTLRLSAQGFSQSARSQGCPLHSFVPFAFSVNLLADTG